MKTLLADPMPPFDIRACPIWAIPQLSLLGRRAGFTLTDFVWEPDGGIGMVTVYIRSQGYYHGLLKKEDMNDTGMIALDWFDN